MFIRGHSTGYVARVLNPARISENVFSDYRWVHSAYPSYLEGVDISYGFKVPSHWLSKSTGKFCGKYWKGMEVEYVPNCGLFVTATKEVEK